ncbi:protein phosphatase 1 regulatory subunit 3C-B-like isoform X2 [Genypterus blacodes]
MLNPPPGVSSPIMSVDVDMAMRICLASSPPLHSFLCNYDNHCGPPTALRPCLAPGRCTETFTNNVTMAIASTTSTNAEISSSQGAWPRRKKSVVFADSRGLALTAVHVFNENEDNALAELQFHLNELEGVTAELNLGEEKDHAGCGPRLVLDFIQPATDYLDLRNRLKAQQVCLESCSLQDRLLSGTVQVRNICFNKSVSVRITFDSWFTFQDVPCCYLNNVYGCPDTDTFSFLVQVPEVLEPTEQVAFCIQYQTQDQIFWDNNQGTNYRIVAAAEANSSPTKSAKWVETQNEQEEKMGEVAFDCFGSPRTSAGIFPEWQSWGSIELSAPYW